MGIYLLDQYTLLHFAVGIICYFWNISLTHTILIHSLFEFIENTSLGMYFINNYITVWPGGKPYTDSFINNIGDTIGIIVGWCLAYYINIIGTRYNYYNK